MSRQEARQVRHRRNRSVLMHSHDLVGGAVEPVGAARRRDQGEQRAPGAERDIGGTADIVRRRGGLAGGQPGCHDGPGSLPGDLGDAGGEPARVGADGLRDLGALASGRGGAAGAALGDVQGAVRAEGEPAGVVQPGGHHGHRRQGRCLAAGRDGHEEYRHARHRRSKKNPPYSHVVRPPQTLALKAVSALSLIPDYAKSRDAASAAGMSRSRSPPWQPGVCRPLQVCGVAAIGCW